MGYAAGLQQKILSGALEEKRRGTRTRLLRFQPGVRTTVPFSHQYWERSSSSNVTRPSAMTRTAMVA